jgi:hypothetical protein
MRDLLMTPQVPCPVSMHISRGRATTLQARRECPHTHAACRSQSHCLGAVAAACVRLVSSSSLAKLIAGGRACGAGWMRRGCAWCANAVGELRTAVRPRLFRRRRRLSCRRRVPLTVAWARQGSAPCPARQSSSTFASWEHTEPCDTIDTIRNHLAAGSSSYKR